MSKEIVQDERFGGFGIRIISRLIMIGWGLLLGGVGTIISVIVLLKIGASGNPAELAPVQTWYRFVMVVLCGYMGDAISQYISGIDLGKYICGLSVVDENNNRVSFKSALIRSFSLVVDGLFFGLVGWSSMSDSVKNQRYGDKWAKSFVIKRKHLPHEKRAGLGRVAVGVVLGSAVWIIPMVMLDVFQVASKLGLL